MFGPNLDKIPETIKSWFTLQNSFYAIGVAIILLIVFKLINTLISCAKCLGLGR